MFGLIECIVKDNYERILSGMNAIFDILIVHVCAVSLCCIGNICVVSLSSFWNDILYAYYDMILFMSVIVRVIKTLYNNYYRYVCVFVTRVVPC